MKDASDLTNCQKARLDVQAILKIVGSHDSEWEKLRIVSRAIAAIIPDFSPDEVQGFLCDLALELEVAAGRAQPSDSAWVNIKITPSDSERG